MISHSGIKFEYPNNSLFNDIDSLKEKIDLVVYIGSYTHIIVQL